jgi:hypothetical protein
MKKHILIIFILILSANAFSQENGIIINGGYASANIEDTDSKGSGFFIRGTYEFSPMGGKFSHGASFGYIKNEVKEGTGMLSTTSTVNSFPIYYAPKFTFGNGKLKIFIKGAIGTQFSGLKREGLITLSDNDFGFYGGGGAGLVFNITETFFVNGEYEIAWASNASYKDGWLSTAGAGIGFRF